MIKRKWKHLMTGLELLPPKGKGWWDRVVYVARCALYVYMVIILTTIMTEAIQTWNKPFTKDEIRMIEKSILYSKS